MKDALRLNNDSQEIERAIEEMEPDAHGLTILPFWAGERSTGWSDYARGTILGLTLHTRPLEILRAMMEAVAYRFALIDEALKKVSPVEEVVATGGALSVNRVWTQVVADALGRPIRLSGVREASLRGATLLALEAAGKIKDIAEVPAPMAQTFEPDMERHARYRVGLERQQKIYQKLVEDEETARLIAISE
jgi:gluconokinase